MDPRNRRTRMSVLQGHMRKHRGAGRGNVARSRYWGLHRMEWKPLLRYAV